MKTQQVVDHGGLADAPRPQEQNHGLRGDLTICTVCDKDTHRKRRFEKEQTVPHHSPTLTCHNTLFHIDEIKDRMLQIYDTWYVKQLFMTFELGRAVFAVP